MAVLDRAYLKNYSESQGIYLPEAFFGFLIAASVAELWSKNPGASLGSDSLIVGRNNSLMAQLKVVSVDNLIKYVAT